MSTRTKHLGTGPVGQPKAATGPTVPTKRASASGLAHDSRAQHPRYQAHRSVMRWNHYLLLLGAVAVTMLLGSAIVGQLSIPKGALTAAQTSYNFGNVPIGGGDITTRFPLVVQGDARAVDITST